MTKVILLVCAGGLQESLTASVWVWQLPPAPPWQSCAPQMQGDTRKHRSVRPKLTIKSERWSEPELKPLVSESEGLLERDSRRERESRREFLSVGVENFSDRSDPMGSRGRKPSGGFPRTFPRGLLSMLRTAREKEPVSAAA